MVYILFMKNKQENKDIFTENIYNIINLHNIPLLQTRS